MDFYSTEVEQLTHQKNKINRQGVGSLGLRI